MKAEDVDLVRTLALREAFRERYRRERDPIAERRLGWRAQTVRHLLHLLPGQTVLELGCGRGDFTRQLVRVSRGQNPVTAVTFEPDAGRPANLPAEAEFLAARDFPRDLAGRRFDCVVAMDLLDRRSSSDVLRHVFALLKPGGHVLFFESNPWNPVLKARAAVGRLLGRGGGDPRQLLSRTALYELMSELGFIRVFAVFNDFVYRPLPLTPRLLWLMRNASVLLENAPGLRRLAGSILLHAQTPPRVVPPPRVSLADHACLRGGVSVVIPCHNEEANIGPLVNRLRDLFGDYLHEIIPVDDNSRDGTRAAIAALAAEDPRVRPVYRTPPNGVGRAIADGYRAASGQWVLSIDCDFQHLLPEMRELFDEAAAGHPVVVGSRFSRDSVLLNYPFQKIVANRAFHLLARLVLLRRFRDLTNNLKLLRREVVEQLLLRQPHFAVNAETGFQPLLMGYEVREVPISWINRTPDMGASSFRLLKVGGGYGRVLWHLLLRRMSGKGPYAGLPAKPATGSITARNAGLTGAAVERVRTVDPVETGVTT